MAKPIDAPVIQAMGPPASTIFQKSLVSGPMPLSVLVRAGNHDRSWRWRCLNWRLRWWFIHECSTWKRDQ